MATIKYGPTQWIAADNLSPEAMRAVMAELEQILSKEKLGLLKRAAADEPGMRARLAAIVAKHSAAHPITEPKSGPKSKAPKSKKPASAKPKSKAAKAAPKSKRPASAKPKSAKPVSKKPASVKPKSEAKPKSGKKPKSAKPKKPASKKTAAKPKSKAPKPVKTPKAKKQPKSKAPASVAKKALAEKRAELKALTTKLRTDMRKLKVECPKAQKTEVESAAFALAAAKAAAKRSPELREARKNLTVALVKVSGAKAAKTAMAKAAKAPEVKALKDRLAQSYMTELAPGEIDLEGVQRRIEADPAVQAAKAALAAARAPAEVKHATEALTAARGSCSAKYANAKGNAAKLQAAIEADVSRLRANAPGRDIAPKTVASTRPA